MEKCIGVEGLNVVWDYFSLNGVNNIVVYKKFCWYNVISFYLMV